MLKININNMCKPLCFVILLWLLLSMYIIYRLDNTDVNIGIIADQLQIDEIDVETIFVK